MEDGQGLVEYGILLVMIIIVIIILVMAAGDEVRGMYDEVVRMFEGVEKILWGH